MVYNFNITLKRFAYSAVAVVIAGLASVYGNNPLYLAIAPFLIALENLIKHWTD